MNVVVVVVGEEGVGGAKSNSLNWAGIVDLPSLEWGEESVGDKSCSGCDVTELFIVTLKVPRIHKIMFNLGT